MIKDQNSEVNKGINLTPTVIETVDSAFFDYINSLEINCNTNEGWQKIPIIWSSAERSYQIKNNKKLRDKNGALVPPIISLERLSITKDPNKKGNFQANLSPKDDRHYITKVLNQDKTSNFANADAAKSNGPNFATGKKNKKVVYEHIAVPIPIYVVCEYKINLLTGYQAQMNEALQPFIAKTAQNYFIIKKDGYRFECFMDQNFAQDNKSDFTEEERKFTTSINIKVLGYVITQGQNEEKEFKKIDENAVEIKIPREKVIVDTPATTRKKIKQLQSIQGLSTSITLPPDKPLKTGELSGEIEGGQRDETSEKSKKLNLKSSSIETIDSAFLEYVENLNVFCNTNEGWEKVPVIWGSAERAYQIKNNKRLRDKNGSLIAPIISLERTSVNKDPNKKGNFQANVSPSDDRYTITKVLNQDKTSNFANADALKKSGQLNFSTSKKNKKLVYQHYSVRIPVYVTVEYKINILTNYQAQMNEIMQPFMAKTAQNYFVIKKDDHPYECFMDPAFQQETINDLSEEERKFKSTITVKVLGYLLGEGENREDRNVNIDENAVEIKIPREKIILDNPDPKKKRKEISSFDSISSGLGSGTSSQVGVSGVVKKTFIIGNAIDSVYTVSHGLNTRDIYVSVRENFGSFYQVIAHIEFPSLNSILVDMGDIIEENSYVVTIMG